MLSTTILDDFISAIHLQGSNFIVMENDASGDFIEMLDTELEFERLKQQVRLSRPYTEKVVDQGCLYVDIRDTIYIDGNKVRIAIYAGQGDMGFGTTLRAMVKSIEYIHQGHPKCFLSFRALGRFLEGVTVV